VRTLRRTYSRELNLDEQGWNNAKPRRTERAISYEQAMKRHFASILRPIQQRTSLIKSFLQLPDTAYVFHTIS
jgi:hypothetical protein